MYFVCTVPFPLLEKQSQAAKAIDTVTSFSNVFSTQKKKVLSSQKIGFGVFFFFAISCMYVLKLFFVVEII